MNDQTPLPFPTIGKRRRRTIPTARAAAIRLAVPSVRSRLVCENGVEVSQVKVQGKGGQLMDYGVRPCYLPWIIEYSQMLKQCDGRDPVLGELLFYLRFLGSPELRGVSGGSCRPLRPFRLPCHRLLLQAKSTPAGLRSHLREVKSRL